MSEPAPVDPWAAATAQALQGLTPEQRQALAAALQASGVPVAPPPRRYYVLDVHGKEHDEAAVAQQLARFLDAKNAGREPTMWQHVAVHPLGGRARLLRERGGVWEEVKLEDLP